MEAAVAVTVRVMSLHLALRCYWSILMNSERLQSPTTSLPPCGERPGDILRERLAVLPPFQQSVQEPVHGTVREAVLVAAPPPAPARASPPALLAAPPPAPATASPPALAE